MLGCASHLKCLNLLFLDEMTAQLTPTLTRAWGMRGEQRQVTAWTRGHLKVHIFGAMDPIRGQAHHRFAKRINAKNFQAFLRRLLKKYPRGTLLLVLDNAFWHKSRSVAEVLSRHKRVHLFFLPKYSPDMNPIELLWKRLRWEVTHNHFFGDIMAMRHGLNTGMMRLNRNPEVIRSLSGQYVNLH